MEMDVRTQTFQPGHPFGQWFQPAELAAALWHVASAVVLAPVRALRWIDNRLAEMERNADEAYLARSADAADLEARMRQLDRRRDPLFRRD
jgi:hypothetical protein